MRGYESAGSIGGGGRYDNLASSDDERYPGVGISFGISRTLGVLFGANALSITRDVATCVLVALTNEESRPAARRVAQALRARGIATEVAPEPAKFGKQIRYADRRRIPYVWFPGADGDEVKDIRSGDQVPASAADWEPPADDLYPRIVASCPARPPAPSRGGHPGAAGRRPVPPNRRFVTGTPPVPLGGRRPGRLRECQSRAKEQRSACC